MMIFALAGCGGLADRYEEYDRTGERYDYDLSEYIAIPEYTNIEIPNITYAPTDEEIENSRMLKRAYFAKEDEVKEPCQKYDLVNAEYSATLEGANYSLFDSSQNASMRSFMVGIGNFGVPEIDDAIIGMSAGETKTIEFTLPEPFLKDIVSSGKSGTFTITITAVRRQDFPEYDNDFVDQYYGFNSVEEYDVEIAEQLTHDRTNSYAGYENKLAWLYISNNAKVYKYPGLELNEAKESVKQFIEASDLTGKEGYGDDFIESYAKSYVKEEMILYFIARCENLVVTDSDFSAAALEYGSYYQVDDPDTCEALVISDFGSKEAFSQTVLLDKARDFIGDNAKKIDTAEYYNNVHDGKYILADSAILSDMNPYTATTFIIIAGSVLGAAAVVIIAVLSVKIAKKKKAK